MSTNAKVARIWRGWTTVENADAYQAVAEGEVFPAIIWFDSLDSVTSFMGEDDRRAHLPECALAVLKRFDSEASHLHLVGEFS